jgi:hypothetical protein
VQAKQKRPILRRLAQGAVKTNRRSSKRGQHRAEKSFQKMMARLVVAFYCPRS